MIGDENKESKTKPFLPLEIYEDKKERWLELYFKINEFSKKDQSVPPGLIKEFFSCFTFKSIVDFKKKHQEAERYKNIILNKFQHSDYNFSFVRDETYAWALNENGERERPLRHKQEYSFQKMVERVLEKILDEEGKIHEPKDECLRNIYSEIKEYKRAAKLKKGFTEYKMKVITAFITMTLGYKLTEKANPANEDLFQSTRSALGDFKKRSWK